MSKRAGAVVLLLGLTAAGNAGASYESAMKDYDAGRYEAAIAELQCLAAEGHSDARFNMAAMYLRGEGTQPDKVMAFAWLRVAAASGDPEAERLWMQIEPQMSGAELIQAEQIEFIATEPERERMLRLAAFGRSIRQIDRANSVDDECTGQFEVPDVAPELVSRSDQVRVTRPDYPEKARAERRTGGVHVGVHLDKTGRVCYATVIESSGHADLDAAAVEAIRGWRWLPAQRDGQPVESITATALGFYLEDVSCLQRHGVSAPAAR